MKIGKIKKRYVKKTEFEALSNEVKRLTKKLAKLEYDTWIQNRDKHPNF